MRRKARLEGRPMRYDGRWRDRDPSKAPLGVAPVIRLRASQEGETVIDDKVQGKVVFANKDSTMVILRSTARRPTCLRSSSMATTWGSPM